MAGLSAYAREIIKALQDDESFYGLLGGFLSERAAATFFAKTVENYSSAASRDNSLLDAITNGMLQLSTKSTSDIYRRCLSGTVTRPNWDCSYSRKAYILRFFTLHSYLVYHTLHLSFEERMDLGESWKSKAYLRVCCIGGGPGSDMVGLKRFLRDRRMSPILGLKCAIFDKYQQWENSWTEIRSANPIKFSTISTTYYPVDITEKNCSLSPGERRAVQEADIFTFVKFFSTVAAFMRRDPAHGSLLREMFREMKPGALVLYIDNCYGSQLEEFRLLASSGGVDEIVFRSDRLQVTLPCSDRDTASGTGVESMQSCIVSVMVLRKKNDTWYRL